MPPVLEIFSDFTSPWCYFITENITKLKQQVNVPVKWVIFCLHPDIPVEGIHLEDLFPGLGLDISRMVAHLKRTADCIGLPFVTSIKIYNSRSAQELVKWADTLGCGEYFQKLVFSACFADGRNIAQLGILKDLAKEAGLSPDEAEQVLVEGRYRAAVNRDWKRSRKMSIMVVPTFIYNDRVLVGAQTCEALKRLVDSDMMSG